MGLDIVSFSKIEKIDKDVDLDDYEPQDGEALLFPFPVMKGDPASAEFASRAEGIDGLYRVEGEISMRVGYTGFANWREWLCRRALGVSCDEVWSDPEKFRGQPFFELIHFADNEGVIGPKTCAKLAADFEEQREKVFGAEDEEDGEEDLMEDDEVDADAEGDEDEDAADDLDEGDDEDGDDGDEDDDDELDGSEELYEEFAEAFENAAGEGCVGYF